MLEHEVRPVRPGAEIGLSDGTKGTFGLLLRNARQERFALTCSHIVAQCGKAAVNTTVIQPVNPFVHPSFVAIGRLTQIFTTLAFGKTANTGDFAVVALDTKIASAPTFISGGVARHVFTGAREDMLNLRTTLCGAMSGAQNGVIPHAQDKTVSVDYKGFGTATFSNAVTYQTICQGGDSGAAVLIEGSDVVLGIHIGAKPPSPAHVSIAYFLPIAEFLSAGGFSLVTN